MAIKTVDEILETIKTKIGDDTSDETISLVQDVTDTIRDLDTWKKKYEDNDATWRKKYRDAFFSGSPAPLENGGDEDEEKKTYKFENLFTEE